MPTKSVNITEISTSIREPDPAPPIPVPPHRKPLDEFLFHEGTARHAYEYLGAHEETDSEGREKRETLDKTVDGLRRRFGDTCIRRAILLEDPALTGSSPYDTHTVHPTGFSGRVEDIGGSHEL